jgi:hypothetical protein
MREAIYMYANSNMADYLGASGVAGSLSGMANAIKQPQQDTLFSLIEQLEKQAYSAKESVQAVADAVAGSQPQPDGANPVPQSAIERLRMVLYALQAVNGEANRARRSLGV